MFNKGIFCQRNIFHTCPLALGTSAAWPAVSYFSVLSMSKEKKSPILDFLGFIYLYFLHRNLVSFPMFSLLPLVRNLCLKSMFFLLHNRADLWCLRTAVVVFSPFLLDAAIMRVWQDEKGSCN